MPPKLCSMGNNVVRCGQGQLEARIVERRQRRLAARSLGAGAMWTRLNAASSQWDDTHCAVSLTLRSFLHSTLTHDPQANNDALTKSLEASYRIFSSPL